MGRYIGSLLLIDVVHHHADLSFAFLLFPFSYHCLGWMPSHIIITIITYQSLSVASIDPSTEVQGVDAEIEEIMKSLDSSSTKRKGSINIDVSAGSLTGAAVKKSRSAARRQRRHRLQEKKGERTQAPVAAVA